MRAQWAGVTALLVVFSSALSVPGLSGLSGAAVPLVMTTLLLAVLALVIAASRQGRPLVRPGVTCQRAGFETRGPARECDPDAAGHVRPRAPGVVAVLLAG